MIGGWIVDRLRCKEGEGCEGKCVFYRGEGRRCGERGGFLLDF